MKKILPAIAILGVGAVLVGGNCVKLEPKTNTINDNIDEFKKEVENYTNSAAEQISNTAFDKYTIRVSAPIDELNENDTNSIQNYGNARPMPLVADAEDPNITNIDNSNDINIMTEDNNIEENIQENVTPTIEEENENPTIDDNRDEKISTLYSLTTDIDNSCGEFCTLKEKLTNAIVETQALINKLQSNEVNLTAEQKMFINEQSAQLKSLSRQLSRSTTELSLSLTDLNQLLNAENGDLDMLSLKYMVVLDNIVNGNEMLENGLHSINMINHMFNMTRPIPPNNRGRILYGFQHNDNPPIVKDYLIDNNGEIKENNEQQNQTTDETNKSNIDTYKTTNLKSNIDTYVGDNPKNIDSFFNTALLDNEFMYGNGYNGYMNGLNPYMNRNGLPYQNQQMQENQPNTNTSVNSNNNTQSKVEKKKFKLAKNIDTYKDENTPSPKIRFNNIKQSVSSFFSRFSNKGTD